MRLSLLLALVVVLGIVSPGYTLVHGSTGRYAVGVAATGQTPYGVTYTVQTQGIYGYVYVQHFGVGTGELTLEMNTVLAVVTSSGIQYFLVRNGIHFLYDTGAPFLDILNETSPGAVISSASGTEKVTQANVNYESQAPSIMPFPMNLNLTTFVRVVGSGVEVCTYQDGSRTAQEVVSIPGATSAQFIVAPTTTPGGAVEDAEMVWGVTGGGYSPVYSFNVSLALYYLDGQGLWEAFPSVTDYGQNDPDCLPGVQASISNSSGNVVLSLGTFNPGFLTSDFQPEGPGGLSVSFLNDPYEYSLNGSTFSGNHTFLLFTPVEVKLLYFTSPSPGVAVGQGALLSGSINKTYPNSFTLQYQGPGRINVTTFEEKYFLLSLNNPLQGSIDGENTTISSGYYPQGTNITFFPSDIVNIAPGIRNVTIGVPSSAILDSPLTVSERRVEQFYLTLHSPYPIYALVNGVNTTLQTGWYDSGSNISVLNVSHYSGYTRFVPVNVSPATSFLLASPMDVYVSFQQQYYFYVNSTLPVTMVISDRVVNSTGIWVNPGTEVRVLDVPTQLNDTTRVITTSGYGTFPVNSPYQDKVIQRVQYLVTISPGIEVRALVDGNETNLSQESWVYSGSTVTLTPGVFYQNSNERWIITSFSPQNFTVTRPVYVEATGYPEYRVNVSAPFSPVFNLSGTLVTNTTLWVRNGTELRLYTDIVQVSPGVRYVINSTEPQLPLRVVSPTEIRVKYTQEFLISPLAVVKTGLTFSDLRSIPFTLEVGGRILNLTSPSWVPSGTVISLYNYSLIFNNGTRLVMTEANFSSLNLSSPVTLLYQFKTQYAVVLDGNVTWVSPYSFFTMPGKEPFYYRTMWVGTYNVTPGTVILVSKPLRESLVSNFDLFQLLIPITIVSLGFMAMIMLYRESRPEEAFP